MRHQDRKPNDVGSWRERAQRAAEVKTAKDHAKVSFRGICGELVKSPEAFHIRHEMTFYVSSESCVVVSSGVVCLVCVTDFSGKVKAVKISFLE